MGGKKDSLKVVDLGCGKLRHLNILCDLFNNIILVDTKFQIERKQKLGELFGTLSEYINKLGCNRNIQIVETNAFSKSNVNADIVLSIAVMGVVIRDSRTSMALSAYSNLKDDGYLLVITPRNDSATLINCKSENMYEDGYYFRNRGSGVYTFYTNYKDHTKLITIFTDVGFNLVEDFSTSRQVCLIFNK